MARQEKSGRKTIREKLTTPLDERPHLVEELYDKLPKGKYECITRKGVYRYAVSNNVPKIGKYYVKGKPHQQAVLARKTKIEKNATEYLSKFFDIFSPHMLAHHFLADFKKTFKNERILLNKLGEKMKHVSLIDEIDLSLINWITEQEEIAYVRDPLPLS